jgi:chemotaxis protein histidine kinase CheA
MALKKVRRPVVKAEEAVTEEKVTPAVEAEEVVEATEEAVTEATPEVATEEVVEEPAKKETKKATTAKAKTTAKKAEDKKEEKKAPAKAKAETKKASAKKIEPKPIKAQEEAGDEEEGARATKKKVMKLTQQFLKENEEIEVSLENITTIINAFEAVLGDVTNLQSYKFMGGMIQVQQRNGQVFKSPKVDYFSYKAPRTVKTFTQDTENVDKYKGQYDADTKVFKADGKWNYETKEFDAVDIEIVVGQEDAE